LSLAPDVNAPAPSAARGRPQREPSAPPPAGAPWSALWRWASERLGDEVVAGRLVEEVSGLQRSRLILGSRAPAPAGAREELATLVERVAAGEPLQYVLGHWAFRTLELMVGPSALIPRPETEVVAGIAIDELARFGGGRAVDLGTGTGAIALSIAVEVPGVEILATDRSPAALAVARENLARIAPAAQARVRLLEGDWYGALQDAGATPGLFDVIVSNPPYVTEDEWLVLDPVVRRFEPREALVGGGPTGSGAIAAVVAGARRWLSLRGTLVVEIAPAQADEAVRFAEVAGFARAGIERDLAGRDRILVARR
jgi:release factor glutamine methyltransferase